MALSPKDQFSTGFLTREQIACDLNSHQEGYEPDEIIHAVEPFKVDDDRLTPKLCGEYAKATGVIETDALNEGYSVDTLDDSLQDMRHRFLERHFGFKIVEPDDQKIERYLEVGDLKILGLPVPIRPEEVEDPDGA